MFDDVVVLIKKYTLSNLWLIGRLGELGITVDRCSFSKWVHGEQINGRAKEVHDICMKILTAYGEKFGDIVKEIEYV